MTTFPSPSIVRGRASDADQVGTINAASGITAQAFGDGILKCIEFTFDAYSLAIADDAGTGQYGGVKIWDFSAGAVQFLGGIVDFVVTAASPIIPIWDGDIGIGTTAVTDGDALATTEQNIVPTTATTTAVASVATVNAQSTITEAGIVIDGTATAADLYVNMRVDDNASHTASTLSITGTMKVYFIAMGDY